jgi:hypothetical protein
MEGKRITLNQAESSTDLDDEGSKPGTPGTFQPSAKLTLRSPVSTIPFSSWEVPHRARRRSTSWNHHSAYPVCDSKIERCFRPGKGFDRVHFDRKSDHWSSPSKTDLVQAILNGSLIPSFSANDPEVLDMLLELVKVPGSQKTWRREVYDAFNENAFFTISPDQAAKWKTILRALLNDKEHKYTTDFISRISAATSSILRSSRDQDRLINVRRLAFIVISGDLDQFIGHINPIKEKLAELARTVSIDQIHAEVCLFYRALLLRLSAVHLVSFWPMMMAEVQSLFTQILEQAGIVSKDQLPLFFEACKLLDMMLVMRFDDFQLCVFRVYPVTNG